MGPTADSDEVPVLLRKGSITEPHTARGVAR